MFAHDLHPWLRLDVLQDEIDLSDIVLTQYSLHQQREVDLDLGLSIGENTPVRPNREGAGATPRDPKQELLQEIIQRMNDLFGSEFTDADTANYFKTVQEKIEEDQTAMDQLRHNTREQAMLGLLPDTINHAVIESMQVHEGMAMKLLANPKIAEGFAYLMFDALKAKLEQSSSRPAG